MNKLSEYSYIWKTDKEKYVLEDDDLLDMIIVKMIEYGNKKYSSVTELQNDIRDCGFLL